MLSGYNIRLSYKEYLINALPSVLSMVFLSFYTTIDGFFVAHSVNSDALAAINIVIPVTCLVFGIAVMLATGSGAIIGELLGERRKEEADRRFSMICVTLLIISSVLTAAGLAAIRPIAAALGSTERLDPHVIPYLSIIIAGTIPMAFKLFFEYLARTDGYPGLALAMSLSGLVLNLVFDFIFVIIMDLGTIGAGLGTFFSIAVSALIGLLHFLKGRNLRFTRFRFCGRTIFRSCTNGCSEMFSELSTGIITLFYNLIVISIYAEDGIAALTIMMYVYYFFIAFYMGLSVASAPLVSYALGEKDYGKIRRIVRYSFRTIALSALILTAAAVVFAPFIAGLFLPSGSSAFSITVESIRLSGWVFLFAGFNVFMSAYFTALGDGLSSAVISTLRALVLVIPSIFLLPRLLGDSGIWLALPVSDALTLFVSFFLYSRCGRIWAGRRERCCSSLPLAEDIGS